MKTIFLIIFSFALRAHAVDCDFEGQFNGEATHSLYVSCSGGGYQRSGFLTNDQKVNRLSLRVIDRLGKSKIVNLLNPPDGLKSLVLDHNDYIESEFKNQQISFKAYRVVSFSTSKEPNLREDENGKLPAAYDKIDRMGITCVAVGSPEYIVIPENMYCKSNFPPADNKTVICSIKATCVERDMEGKVIRNFPVRTGYCLPQEEGKCPSAKNCITDSQIKIYSPKQFADVFIGKADRKARVSDKLSGSVK